MGLVFELLRSQFVRGANRTALSSNRRGAIAPPNIGFLCLKNFCLGGISVRLYPIRVESYLSVRSRPLVSFGMQEVFVDVVFNPAVQILRVLGDLLPIDMLIIRDLNN